MSYSRNPDEVKQEQIRVLGEQLGKFYNRLYIEFYLLQLKWQEYVELYGTSPERIEILNAAAPSFFHFVEDVLWDDLLMHIARLTDRPKTAGKENLTFRALPDLIDMPLRTEIDRLVSTALQASDFTRDLRNRRLAHRDLQLALGTAVTALPPASRNSIREAIAALHAVLDAVERRCFGNEGIYPEVLTAPGGANRLLHILSAGVKAEKDRTERLRSGNTLPDDFKPAPPI